MNGNVAAFRGIVWKEVRQAMKAAVGACAIVSIGLLLSTSLAEAIGTIGLYGTSPFFVSVFTLTSAAAALLIGGAQVVSERRGDMWALLTHRPVSRSMLFWGKVVAGAAWYLLAAGIPLAISFVWRATGHDPMPFVPKMMLPGVADLLCGLVFYFAAFMATMRRARWYAGGGLPVLAALAFMLNVAGADAFVPAIALIAIGIVVSAEAARGTFVAGGFYAPQLRPSRVASALVIGPGLFVVGSIAVLILGDILEVEPARPTGPITYSEFVIAGDGSMVKATWQSSRDRENKLISVTDLADHPLDRLKDSLVQWGRLGHGVISTPAIPLNLSGAYPASYRRGYRGTEDIFIPLVREPTFGATSWYFMRDLGLIDVYANYGGGRRHIGWMGPDGYVSGEVFPAHRFEGEFRPYADYTAYYEPLVVLPSAVYRLNIDDRTIRRVFTASPGEEVLGAAASGNSTTTTTDGPRARFDAIATTKAIYVQSPDGTPQLTVPRDSNTMGDGTVTVARAMLAPGAPTFVWYQPRYGTLTQKQLDHAKDRITKFAGDNTVAAVGTPWSATWIGNRPAAAAPTQWAQIIVTNFFVPATVPALAAARDAMSRESTSMAAEPVLPMRAGLISTIAGALAAALIAWTVASRYAFDASRRGLWMAIGFALGPLGVLLMLSLLEWPARTTCPSCRRKRVVNREQCEHCGAPFAPPATEGIEIFEEAVA